MDDLKVILYVVVALIWIVYNNYKKLREAAKKRDLRKPPVDTSVDRTSEKKTKPVSQPKQQREIIEKQPRKVLREILVRKPVSIPATRQQKTFQERPAFITNSYTSEGGSTTPSKIVNFEETSETKNYRNPILDALKSMDLRSGIIMAEVLKRPYN